MAVLLNEQDTKFKYDVAEEPGGENIKLCFACGLCTAGCPVADIDPEYNPRRIIRMVILGMRKGETRPGPFAFRSEYCCSVSVRPPMPEPMTTPQRVGSSWAKSRPASSTAMAAAAMAGLSRSPRKG